MLREALGLAVGGQHLTRAQAEAALEAMLDGQAPAVLVGALLVALRVKGETPDEIAGAALALRKRAIAVQVSPERRAHLVDTCGTGGDGAHTFNISTAAAFVAAAAGATVAKHGNRSVSSKCGSADVLEALGVSIELSAASVGRCLEELGIGFLFAQRHHAAMRHVGPVRKELGLRTLFNLLGPLANPAGAERQLLGVYASHLVPVMAQTLAELGCLRAFVVHAECGLDEIAPAGRTRIAEVRRDAGTSGAQAAGILERWVSPGDFGLPEGDLAALRGGAPAENALALRAILAGEPGPRRTAVLLNAAAALVAADIAQTLSEGVDRAARAIDAGDAAAKLAALIGKSAALAEEERAAAARGGGV
jgi:anthranilate phosphoribosyltransferase